VLFSSFKNRLWLGLNWIWSETRTRDAKLNYHLESVAGMNGRVVG
jgi:hypothetical protein